jgi:hypothetical protein
MMILILYYESKTKITRINKKLSGINNHRQNAIDINTSILAKSDDFFKVILSKDTKVFVLKAKDNITLKLLAMIICIFMIIKFSLQ